MVLQLLMKKDTPPVGEIDNYQSAIIKSKEVEKQIRQELEEGLLY